MAYLQEEREIVEMDFPINVVWETSKKVISCFDWTIVEIDESTCCMHVKTKEVCFLSCATVLSVEVKVVSDNVSRVTVSAETPVTTMTSVNFAKTQAYINSFLGALSLELSMRTTN